MWLENTTQIISKQDIKIQSGLSNDKGDFSLKYIKIPETFYHLIQYFVLD